MRFLRTVPHIVLLLENIELVGAQAVLDRRLPYAEHAVVLADIAFAINAGEFFRCVDVEYEQAVRIEERVYALEGGLQCFRLSDVVYAVQTAQARVYRAVQVQLLHTLIEQQWTWLAVQRVLQRLHEHFRRCVRADHIIAALRQNACQTAGSARQIEHQRWLYALPLKQALEKVSPFLVAHVIREAVMDGYSVLTKTCQYTPRVAGSWIGSSAKFDPEKHKVTLDLILASEMRESLSHVGVEVLTVKDSGANIGLVVNTFTGLSNDVITPGDDIRIEGEKIRVSGEAEGVGVFFIASDGTEHPVTRRLTTNDPKCLLARVPSDLADGQYTLRIVTQFSNTTTLLKEPRTIEYERPLTVGNGGSGGGDRPEIE